MLARNQRAPRGNRFPASSLTSIVGTPPGASSLLQKRRAGRALARQASFRCSSGEWRVAPCGEAAHIAGRCSEANRRAMPPDECRSEGTPSLSEGPYVRGETFWFLLCRLTKGTRRKGGTISRRYPKNGYVLRQAAFASKPAPTEFSSEPPITFQSRHKKGDPKAALMRYCPNCRPSPPGTP